MTDSLYTHYSNNIFIFLKNLTPALNHLQSKENKTVITPVDSCYPLRLVACYFYSVKRKLNGITN